MKVDELFQQAFPNVISYVKKGSRNLTARQLQRLQKSNRVFLVSHCQLCPEHEIEELDCVIGHLL